MTDEEIERKALALASQLDWKTKKLIELAVFYFHANCAIDVKKLSPAARTQNEQNLAKERVVLQQLIKTIEARLPKIFAGRHN